MDARDAQRVIDALRYGVPPEGYIRHFTVGRAAEIGQLTKRLRRPQPGALLLKANYGSGKTHLLRFLREEALAQNYAVSSVTLDAQSAVRFNRMDQVMAAVWRGLEVPGKDKRCGIRPFLDLMTRRIEESVPRVDQNAVFWHKVTNYSRWDYSKALESPAMYIALRAWVTYRPNVRDLVIDWFSQPWAYQAQRKKLYEELILSLRPYFRDPRSERKFYNPVEGIFHFQQQDYAQSWGVLRDIHRMSVAAGLKGFIILFDEFEDVLYNMRNIGHQQAAFWNLFQFYAGDVFPSMTFFAVTPGFVQKCKVRLMEKHVWDYDFERFDALPTFEMSPLGADHLHEVALKIRDVYATAYALDERTLQGINLQSLVARTSAIAVEDRARHTIREVVKALDDIHAAVA
jgi:hypothetical protein